LGSLLRPRGLHCIRDEPMHCLLSLSPNHRGGGLRSVRNPCSFRWSRTPWPPTSCARLPRQVFRWLNLYKGQSPLLVFAFDLSVLNLRRPLCSSIDGRVRDGIWARTVSPRPLVCTLPLTTMASQCLPIAYPPASGPCNL